MRDLTIQNSEIKEIFDNDEGLLYFSGDVLFKTLSRFLYLRSEKISDIFIEEVNNLKHQVFEPVGEIEFLPQD